MATTVVSYNNQNYNLNTEGDMSPEAQEEQLTAELTFAENDQNVQPMFALAKTNDLEGAPSVGGGVFIAVNLAPNGMAALWWKYLSGGNPDTTRWFPN